MKTYHVTIAVRLIETYQIRAENPECAEESWFRGNRVHPNYETCETKILTVREV